MLITGALVLALVAGMLFVPEVSQRAGSILDVQENENRLNLWTSAWNMFLDHPVLGIGQDNWDYHFEKYRVEGWYDTIAHTHNDYLNVLTSSGIPGLVAFVGMWAVALRRAGVPGSGNGSDLQGGCAWSAAEPGGLPPGRADPELLRHVRELSGVVVFGRAFVRCS